mgnify:CR=1 FL=1
MKLIKKIHYYIIFYYLKKFKKLDPISCKIIAETKIFFKYHKQ